jgi:hypothetical protein
MAVFVAKSNEPSVSKENGEIIDQPNDKQLFKNSA